MKPTRRDVLMALAATPLLGVTGTAWADETENNTLALVREAFIVNGKPRFLIGGSVDYFRCPSALWRDRLLKAKRMGLNTIATYVAWNFHEEKEGIFNFTDDRDLPRFLDLCSELELFVFLRPGPFICGEWEAAGYPAWLMGRSDVELRSNHPVTMTTVRRWFEQLIPRVAPKQVTRGGAVVLVQQENEYFFVGRPGAREYQDFLIHTMREFGIDVPIGDCNGFAKEIRRPESLQTYNGWHPSIPPRLRKAQPGKPVIISEFYTHWTECWGEAPHNEPTTAQVKRETYECLAAAAMPMYFMFHGGTSFGFGASRSGPADYSCVTPQYYIHGPVTQGGALTEMYYALKSVTQTARSLEDVFAGSRPAKLPVALEGPLHGMARSGTRGTLLFLLNSEEDHGAAADAVMTLPSGRRLTLAQSASIPAILPFDLETGGGHKIDFANATVVAISPDAIVISGDEGRAGVISVDGQVAEFTFSADPQLLSPGGATVLAVPTPLSARTWLADGRVILGPAGVGERRGNRHECWCDAHSTVIRVLSPQGKLIATPLPAAAAAAEPRAINLTDWRSSGFPELRGKHATEKDGWRALDAPAYVEDMGAYLGYTWYRAQYHCDQPRRTSLMFTDATDRVHVFQNGKRIGIFGRGDGASRDPLLVDLAADDNPFMFLCDNMGRSSEGNAPDRKGIGGAVCVDAEELKVSWTSQSPPAAAPTNSWRFQTYQSRTKDHQLSRATGEFTASAGQKLVISLRSMPQFAWISVNGAPIAEHGGNLTLIDGYLFSTYVVDQATAGAVKLEIVTSGEALQDIAPHVRVIGCPQDRALQGWRFRPWTAASGNEPVSDGQPVCWRTEFENPKITGPLFFDPGDLSKGHVFLNGRAVARYWHIGPQKQIYLPEPWLKDRNELIVFDELGHTPSSTRLIGDPQYPTRMVLA